MGTSGVIFAYDSCPGGSGASLLLFRNLEDALDNLEKDHSFLLKGDVFTEDVIDMWVSYKREAEIDKVKMRPCPEEFALYFDC